MTIRFQQKKTLARFVIALCTACFLLLIVWVGQILFPPKIPTSDDPVHFYSNQVGKDIKEALLHSMEEAKKSILVIVYTLNDDEVMETLRQKSDEGLEVKVIVDKSGYRKGKSRIGKNTTLIKRKGKGLMHEKVVVVDKELVWMGSTNFTNTAFALHDNLMQAIWHPPLAEKWWERSNMMTPKGQLPLFTPYAFQAGVNKAELWITPNPIDAPQKLESLIDSAKKTLKIALFTWTHKDLAKKSDTSQR